MLTNDINVFFVKKCLCDGHIIRIHKTGITLLMLNNKASLIRGVAHCSGDCADIVSGQNVDNLALRKKCLISFLFIS